VSRHAGGQGGGYLAVKSSQTPFTPAQATGTDMMPSGASSAKVAEQAIFLCGRGGLLPIHMTAKEVRQGMVIP